MEIDPRNSNSEDTKLEAYLRQFQPANPSALPRPRVHGSRWRWVAVAAAVVVIGAFLVIERAGDEPLMRPAISQRAEIPKVPSLGQLSALARQDPEKLGAALDALSPQVLPDVQRSQGVLKTLARP